jgi:hypothetical protein
VGIGAHEDIDPVAIEGHGEPDGGEHLVEQGGVAVEIFGRAEV